MKTFGYILITLFLWDNVILKAMLLIICYILLYRLLKKRYNPIKDNFPDKYKLITKLNHFNNIFILLLYTGLFTFGILWLRFQNVERTLDLGSYFNQLILLISNASYYSVILNFLLLSLLLSIYVMLLILLGRYYKYHIIKRHIYLSNGNKKDISFYNGSWILFLVKISVGSFWHLFIIVVQVIYRCCNFKMLHQIIVNPNNRMQLFKNYILEYKAKNMIESFLSRTLYDIKNYVHHLICFVIFAYDLIFNHMIVIHVFQILPYVFIYEVWVRVINFYDHIYYVRDSILYSLLYDPVTRDMHTGIIYTSYTELTEEDFKDIIFNYLFTGLVCQDQKESYQPKYLKGLRKSLLNKCIMTIRKISRRIWMVQKSYIGFTIIDYIVIGELGLLITIFN